MNLKLSEIIWEITNLCNRNCSYCGSKNRIKRNILDSNLMDVDKIINIAKAIAKYPPSEITLSGGEPGMIDLDNLHKIVDILVEAGIKVKVVTNGKMLETADDELLKKFTAIGISVNTMADIDYINAIIGAFIAHSKLTNIELPLTAITNFGRHNIWEFDSIGRYITDTLKVKCWQVQLTIDTDNSLRLPAEGISFLKDKIKKFDGGVNLGNSTLTYAINSTTYSSGTYSSGWKVQVVEADNLRDNFECPAGFQSLGILFNGDVVGCLSERAWDPDIKTYGNVLYTGFTGLKNIWETEFRDRRFGKCRCCRDCFTYPPASLTSVPKSPQDGTIVIPVPHVEEWPKPDKWPVWPSIKMYGVAEPTIVYGVYVPQVTMYGCAQPGMDYGTFSSDNKT